MNEHNNRVTYIMDFTNNNQKSQLFKATYSLYSRRIYNYVLRITHNDYYAADEVTQQVFMKLWEKVDTIQDTDKLKEYLFAIAHNTLVNHLKKETLRQAFDDLFDNLDVPDNSSISELEGTMLHEYIMELQFQLPPRRRSVFVLSKIKCLSNKEISEKLGISVRTVEAHLALALRFIREELQRKYGVEIPHGTRTREISNDNPEDKEGKKES